jgi:hypothetical protein
MPLATEASVPRADESEMATVLSDVLRPSRPMREEAPTPVGAPGLRILFLVSAHNSLSQRAYIALTELGHELSVEVVDSAQPMEAAVAQHRPELIVCLMLKKIIPESIYKLAPSCAVSPPAGHTASASHAGALEAAAGHPST